MDRAFVEQMKKKLAREIAAREIEVLELWRDELEKIMRHKTESLAALQQELKQMTVRMNNRLQVLKRSADY
jgi:chaperonin cofactor prefoldin